MKLIQAGIHRDCKVDGTRAKQLIAADYLPLQPIANYPKKSR
jgi:hypothetical protein